MSYVAFFDVDHTLLKINSGEAILRSGYQHGLLTLPRFLHALWMAGRYKLHLEDPYKIMTKFADWLAGVKVSEFDEFSKELTLKFLVPSIRPEMIREVERHKAKGAHLLILSSSLQSVCKPLAEYFEMDSVLCSELEIQDGVYSGIVAGEFCFREEKLRRMDEYLKNSNYNREDAYYYGDSTDDLPVLQAVGHPVCVYPKYRLAKTAKKQGWRVIPE